MSIVLSIIYSSIFCYFVHFFEMQIKFYNLRMKMIKPGDKENKKPYNIISYID